MSESESRMWNVECGMWNAECGVWNAECGVWNVEHGMWNAECGISNVKCQMSNVKCQMWRDKHILTKDINWFCLWEQHSPWNSIACQLWAILSLCWLQLMNWLWVVRCACVRHNFPCWGPDQECACWSCMLVWHVCPGKLFCGGLIVHVCWPWQVTQFSAPLEFEMIGSVSHFFGEDVWVVEGPLMHQMSISPATWLFCMTASLTSWCHIFFVMVSDLVQKISLMLSVQTVAWLDDEDQCRLTKHLFTLASKMLQLHFFSHLQAQLIAFPKRGFS